jgi:CheY-like chemotaxis protein
MLNILVIDDEEKIRKSLVTHLTCLGHNVSIASSPFDCQCVKKGVCQRVQPCADVIISDQSMPQMTGLDFFSTREARGCKGVHQRLAIMSANFTQEDIDQAEKLKCKIFIKPFSLEAVELWIEAGLTSEA